MSHMHKARHTYEWVGSWDLCHVRVQKWCVLPRHTVHTTESCPICISHGTHTSESVRLPRVSRFVGPLLCPCAEILWSATPHCHNTLTHCNTLPNTATTHWHTTAHYPTLQQHTDTADQYPTLQQHTDTLQPTTQHCKNVRELWQCWIVLCSVSVCCCNVG